MKFRLTARENQIGGGCSSLDDVEISVAEEAGPFVINHPTDTTQWRIGTTETITWEVANTDIAPINTEAVDIYLSTDGGLTYPTLLVEDVPNNGEALIVVPNIITDEAIVMVKASNNIFFDISDQHLKIQALQDLLWVCLKIPNLEG